MLLYADENLKTVEAGLVEASFAVNARHYVLKPERWSSVSLEGRQPLPERRKERIQPESAFCF